MFSLRSNGLAWATPMGRLRGKPGRRAVWLYAFLSSATGNDNAMQMAWPLQRVGVLVGWMRGMR